ncbi:hypothetical protein Neosp_008965 [[Neocosmospora] mangrovei]
MTRKTHGRKYGDKNGYKPPDRDLYARDQAAELRQAQPPTQGPPRGNQQASNARGRSPEPARSPRGRSPRGRSSRGDSPRGRDRRDASPSRNDRHRGGSAYQGNHGGSRPAQKYHGHGRPHDPQSRRQDKLAARREPRLTNVPEMKEVSFYGAQGREVAKDAVNPSLGEGPQNNIACPTDKGFWVQSNVPNHVARLTELGMANGASGYFAKVEMIYEDGIARARRNKQLDRSVQSSAGRTRPKLRADDAFGEGPPLAARITQPQRPADEPATQAEERVVEMSDVGEYRCENCEELGHNIDRCLKVPEGALHACILCHSDSHCVDECDTFKAMSLQEKVKLLVFDRSSMPPLETTMHWFKWLNVWLAHPDSRGQAQPTGFPWSEAYTSQMGEGYIDDVDALQEEFDQHQDAARLPIDPATADLEAVGITYGNDPGNPGELAASDTVHSSLGFDHDMDTSPVE